VGLAGPYNFVPDRPNTKIIFGPTEKYPLMRTENFVNGNEPPMLLLHGDADTTVGIHNQEILLASLNEVGNPSSGKLYPGVSHIGIVASLTPLLKKNTTTLEDMDAFFKNLSVGLNGDKP
jgi:dipeptidyl aminopeptidase/acylaminoacyl peptidase